MKLAVGPFMVACSAIWGLALLFCGLFHWWFPPYAEAFLNVMASVYPGYTAEASFGSVLNGTLYALIDGAVGGLVFASFYNLLAGKCQQKANG